MSVPENHDEAMAQIEAIAAKVQNQRKILMEMVTTLMDIEGELKYQALMVGRMACAKNEQST